MKKALYFGVAALAIVSFFSCEKQGIIEPENNLITVTLTADKAGDETKAAAVEGDNKVSFEWTATDQANLKLFQVTTTTENGAPKEVLTEIEGRTISVSSDKRILTITATVEANTTLRAVVAGEFTGSNKPKVMVSQSPATDNYDPASDVLVADDVTVSEATDLALSFHRQAVINKMTLKNMVAGEKVNKVTISSTVNITGYYEYSSDSMLGQNKEIVVHYADVEVGSNEEFPVYFVAMPNAGLTLTVEVKTDQYIYTKTFGNGGINFNLNKFSRFGVSLSGCGEPVVDVDYSGEWVIAGTHGDYDLAATAWTSGNFYPASVVTLDAENEVVTIYGESTDPYKMTISRIESGDYKDMYTIVDANGKYLSATGGTSSNYLAGKATPDNTSYWSIEKNTDGTYNIIASKITDSGAHNEMRVNYNGGSNPRVTCYGASSGQPKVVLYPFANIVIGEPPTPTYDFETIAQLNSLVTTTSTSYSGHLTNAIVSFVPTTGNAIIKDATGSIMYYKSSHGLKQGQTYTGEITVTAILYNSLYSEITAISGATFTGSQTTVAPENVTLSSLIGHYSEYQNAYVSVAGLTVVSISDKNINVTDGTNNYVVFFNPGNPTYEVGDVITAVGTVTKYSSTEEIKVWSASDITVTSSAPKAITFNQPASGGSFTVSVGGSNITSGTTVASGTTVTLTATAEEGYSFLSWTVTGATVSGNTANATFTMGTSNVSITAVFSSNSSSANYEYTFTSKQFSNTGAKTLNGVSWTLSGTPNYYGYEDARGQQFGSKNSPATDAILSTSGVPGMMSTIKISAAAYSTSATLEVLVGGTSWGSKNLTGTNTEYTFTGSGSGEVVIKLTNPASGGRALYIKKISIN